MTASSLSERRQDCRSNALPLSLELDRTVEHPHSWLAFEDFDLTASQGLLAEESCPRDSRIEPHRRGR